MKKVLINYSDDRFEAQQKWNTRFARCFGGFDTIIEYRPKDIDAKFYKSNEHIFNQGRGGGYFLWKPYIIVKTLKSLNDGDYLFYADSGSVMIRKVDHLINALEYSNQDIMIFTLPLIEKQFTKRDAFILLDCDNPSFTESNQRLSSYILTKKTKYSLEFFKEYLKFCQDDRILTDKGNTLGLNNYPEFIEHRHDQSILSLLSKKWGIVSFQDPSHRGLFLEQYSDYLQREVPKSNYPIIIISNRGRNIFYYIPWFFLKLRLKYKIKSILKTLSKKFMIF